MDKMAKSNLETMIEIYKKRRSYMDFVNFQEKLKSMKEEVERLKTENSRFKTEIKKILKKIEEYQTPEYTNYIKRFFELKTSEITSMISRLKGFMSIKDEKRRS